MLEKGTVVRSLAGRDKDKLLVIIGSDEKSVLLCDGKERPIDRPKSKNIRHVESIGITVTEAGMSTNRALKKALGRLSAEINGNT